MKTRDRLASELRKVAAIASPDNAAKYEAFAQRAETGEFDDYASTYVCPITQLHSELTAAGFNKFAARVADGEFDATKEESDEWANSPEGQAIAQNLTPAMRETLGMKLKQPASDQLLMTTGKTDDGRELAIITSGGHPQLPGSGPCRILEVELVDNMPNRDTAAWFIRMNNERPWETRQ
jgi:hypothetical protein